MGLFGLPAQAVIITVGGVNYDVRYFDGPFNTPQPSFDDNAAALLATPWFGNQTLATAFAVAYGVQVPADSFDLGTRPTEYLIFAYQATATTVDYMLVRNDGHRIGPVTSRQRVASFPDGAYAYTVPIAAVPEIDGNALAKALFLLFTLYVWLQVRRNRRVA